MNTYIRQFDEFKDRIPQFVVKLYHILENKENKDYICWGNDDEIILKNKKKLQEKVLSLYFRHKNQSSFIRQLNMYKFSKVVKLTKQKDCIYFKNEHFKRGQIQMLTMIKRSNKKQKIQSTPQDPQKIQASPDHQDSEMSINNQIEGDLDIYKQYIKNLAKELYNNIKKIQTFNTHDQIRNEINNSILLCNQMLENNPQTPIINHNFTVFNMQDHENKNIFTTIKLIPNISIIFPSENNIQNQS